MRADAIVRMFMAATDYSNRGLEAPPIALPNSDFLFRKAVTNRPRLLRSFENTLRGGVGGVDAVSPNPKYTLLRDLHATLAPQACRDCWALHRSGSTDRVPAAGRHVVARHRAGWVWAKDANRMIGTHRPMDSVAEILLLMGDDWSNDGAPPLAVACHRKRDRWHHHRSPSWVDRESAAVHRVRRAPDPRIRDPS